MTAEEMMVDYLNTLPETWSGLLRRSCDSAQVVIACHRGNFLAFVINEPEKESTVQKIMGQIEESNGEVFVVGNVCETSHFFGEYYQFLQKL